MTKIEAGYIKACYYFVEDFLLDSLWLLIAAIIFLPCLIAGGLRLGLYSLFVIYFWGGTGMWDESMQTLALMGLSVLLCVVFGVTLGVMCSQSDRFDNFMKPILDTMQVMPAFVYLFPALFFFGIGQVSPLIVAGATTENLKKFLELRKFSQIIPTLSGIFLVTLGLLNLFSNWI